VVAGLSVKGVSDCCPCTVSACAWRVKNNIRTRPARQHNSCGSDRPHRVDSGQLQPGHGLLRRGPARIRIRSTLVSLPEIGGALVSHACGTFSSALLKPLGALGEVGIQPHGRNGRDSGRFRNHARRPPGKKGLELLFTISRAPHQRNKSVRCIQLFAPHLFWRHIRDGANRPARR